MDTAAFGIAGPVTNGVCEGENLDGPELPGLEVLRRWIESLPETK